MPPDIEAVDSDLDGTHMEDDLNEEEYDDDQDTDIADYDQEYPATDQSEEDIPAMNEKLFKMGLSSRGYDSNLPYAEAQFYIRILNPLSTHRLNYYLHSLWQLLFDHSTSVQNAFSEAESIRDNIALIATRLGIPLDLITVYPGTYKDLLGMIDHPTIDSYVNQPNPLESAIPGYGSSECPNAFIGFLMEGLIHIGSVFPIGRNPNNPFAFLVVNKSGYTRNSTWAKLNLIDPDYAKINFTGNNNWVNRLHLYLQNIAERNGDEIVAILGWAAHREAFFLNEIEALTNKPKEIIELTNQYSWT